MSNFNDILNNSLNFSFKYMIEYLKELIKPILFGFLGCVFFAFVFIKPELALIGLLSIPLFCYAFWRGYVITYALIMYSENYNNKQVLNNNLLQKKIGNFLF